MGLADRDYMRKRHAERQGLRWNERRSRLEFDEADLLARQYRRRRGGRSVFRIPRGPRMVAGLALGYGCLIIGISLIRDLIDFNRSSFPGSGSVLVSGELQRRNMSARLAIAGSEDLTIVRLVSPRTRHVVLSIYMRPHDRRLVPAPTGAWHVDLAAGPLWFGARKSFGGCADYRVRREPVLLEAGSVERLDLSESKASVRLSHLLSLSGWCALGFRAMGR